MQSAQRFFSLPCGQGLHSAHLRLCLSCGQGLQSAQRRFSLPCGQGLHIRAVAFQLAMRAAAAVRAGALRLAVRAGVTVRAVKFQLAMRAWVAVRAFAFQLAMRAGVAVRAVAFHLAMRAPLHTYHEPLAPPLRNIPPPAPLASSRAGAEGCDRERLGEEISPTSGHQLVPGPSPAKLRAHPLTRSRGLGTARRALAGAPRFSTAAARDGGRRGRTPDGGARFVLRPREPPALARRPVRFDAPIRIWTDSAASASRLGRSDGSAIRFSRASSTTRPVAHEDASRALRVYRRASRRMRSDRPPARAHPHLSRMPTMAPLPRPRSTSIGAPSRWRSRPARPAWTRRR